jgi:hypothetical protein
MKATSFSQSASAQTDSLYSMARQRIFERLLPIGQPRNQIGTEGSGKACCVCAGTIRRDEIEYQAQSESSEVLRFHVQCYLAWQDVRRSIRAR